MQNHMNVLLALKVFCWSFSFYMLPANGLPHHFLPLPHMKASGKPVRPWTKNRNMEDLAQTHYLPITVIRTTHLKLLEENSTVATAFDKGLCSPKTELV